MTTHNFKIGDKIKFSQETINRFHRDKSLDVAAYNLVMKQQVHTITNITHDIIWIDNDTSFMTGSWRVDIFPIDKVNTVSLPDNLFTL